MAIPKLVIQNEKAKKLCIAIIDDDKSIQSLIQTSIESIFTDVNVVKFEDARKTIFELWESDLVSRPNIDLIFLDIHLENKTNGLDVLEFCQYMPEKTPVVLMSSVFSIEQLDKISKLNITPRILRKPFGPIDIQSLAKWIFR